MIEIKDYTAEFEEDLRDLDTDMYLRINSEMGYVTESACVAILDDEFVGAGMLKYNSESFIDLSFKTIFGLDPEIEVAISEALIEDLMLTYQISVLGVDEAADEGGTAADEAADEGGTAAGEEVDESGTAAGEEVDESGTAAVEEADEGGSAAGEETDEDDATAVNEADEDYDEEFGIDEEAPMLRIWCDINAEEYREMLGEIGYIPGRTLIRMSYISGVTEPTENIEPLRLTFTAEDENPIVDNVEEMECRLVVLGADNLEDETAGHYMIAEATAFEELPDESDFSYRMNRDGAEIWAIMCAEGIVAAATAEADLDDKHAFEIGHVFCDEDFRGQGLVSALLRTMINELERRGISRISLSVFADNPGAIGLYRKLGFKTGSKLVEMIYDPAE